MFFHDCASSRPSAHDFPQVLEVHGVGHGVSPRSCSFLPLIRVPQSSVSSSGSRRGEEQGGFSVPRGTVAWDIHHRVRALDLAPPWPHLCWLCTSHSQAAVPVREGPCMCMCTHCINTYVCVFLHISSIGLSNIKRNLDNQSRRYKRSNRISFKQI